MELNIVSKSDDQVHVKASGEIRQRKLPGDKEPLGELLGDDVYDKKVLLDLSEVKYVDSSGLGWLVVCQKRFKEHKGAIVLHSLPQMVSNVLKIVQLDKVFFIADDADSAAGLDTSS